VVPPAGVEPATKGLGTGFWALGALRANCESAGTPRSLKVFRRSVDGSRGDLSRLPLCPEERHTPYVPRFAKATGVRPPRNHYHWLHGSFVTELVIGQGVDVVTATQLGGWSDPGVVFRHYLASDPDRMRAAMLKLGRKAS